MLAWPFPTLATSPQVFTARASLQRMACRSQLLSQTCFASLALRIGFHTIASSAKCVRQRDRNGPWLPLPFAYTQTSLWQCFQYFEVVVGGIGTFSAPPDEANTASLLVLLLAGWGVSNKLACLMKCMTPAACVRGTRCPRGPPTNCTVRQRIGTLLHGDLSGVVLGEVANSHGALQRERLHGQTRGSRGDQVVALA